ncbi:siderophore-interacting protein [Amycolatopsis sp. NPDC059657]|uniref:siderophore-interacting protein n=1 Tax=Amycolatopsis sp. NPDC059657 TaxID=3346899 RepID=UPI00366F56A0
MTKTSIARPAQLNLTDDGIRVAGIRELTPHLTRFTFEGETLADFEMTGPCSYIKLLFPVPGHEKTGLPRLSDNVMAWNKAYLAMPDHLRPPMRTYTIRAIRRELGELDVDFVMHTNGGPGTRWASGAKKGDRLTFLGPRSMHTDPDYRSGQLLIGDDSGLPSIGTIIDGLPEGTVAHAYLEVEGPQDEITFDTKGNVEITWVHRGAAPHGEAVVEALRQGAVPESGFHAWIFGERNLVKFARRQLVQERGVDKRSITFSGYWRRGLSEDQVRDIELKAGEVDQIED